MSELPLRGIDGANPIGFLSALGTLRSLSLACPAETIRLAWQRKLAWIPVIHSSNPLNEASTCTILDEWLSKMEGNPALGGGKGTELGDDLNVAPGTYRVFAEAASSAATPTDRSWADFAAALACDALTKREGLIQDTAFRTMSGAGHQHFLLSMRKLVELTNETDLQKALFEPWAYEDDGPTMRWDPSDDRRYALRWGDPSKSKNKIQTVRGANRLAVEALPLFPSVPDGSVLRTTGFRGHNASNTYWRWPIWARAVNVDVARSLLSAPCVTTDPIDRAWLHAMGIVEVFESRRITVGKFRNFTPSRSL